MRDRKGITPAVAVALLLVVTVAITSAIVYSVTRSTPAAQEKPPQATFYCEIKSGTGGYIMLKQVSGDAINTEDIKLMFATPDGKYHEVTACSNNTFYSAWGYPVNGTGTAGTVNVYITINNNTDWVPSGSYTVYLINASDGSVYKSQTISSSSWFNQTVTDPNGKTLVNVAQVQFTDVDTTTDYWVYVESSQANANVTSSGKFITSTDDKWNAYFYIYEYTSPWHMVPGQMPNDYPEHHFGKYTLTSGEVAKACELWGSANGVDDVCAILGTSWNNLEAGDTVKVKIVHTPTSTVIWQSDVVVK